MYDGFDDFFNGEIHNNRLVGFQNYLFCLRMLVFFQNKDIFVQLDYLDELDRITDARIGFNCSPTQAQKTF